MVLLSFIVSIIMKLTLNVKLVTLVDCFVGEVVPVLSYLPHRVKVIKW
jgi:hypothetical protein